MKNHKKGSTKRQKIYKMKGCSSKNRKTSKNSLGGSNNKINLANYDLAYPAKGVTFLPNPHLAYTGKGGSSNLACAGDTNVNGYSTKGILAYTGSGSDTAAAYPSPGPPAASQNWLNSQQSGGSCNCGSNYSVQSGGCACGLLQSGGSHSHRDSCKCSACKRKSQKGGNGLPYGQGLPQMKDIAYPNGLTGAPWKPPIPDWPGVDGVSGDRNHLSYNTYSPNDVSRQMVSTGANPPFSIGGASRRKSTKQKGGVSSNFLSQDLLNLGRQIQFNIGSTYNALNGYRAPVSPLPWKDQFASTTNNSKFSSI
jgi:hypothetical protein